MAVPFVSVAVPTRNRADRLAACVGTLLVQDYPGDRYEVLLVDDGSTDDTPAVVRELQGRTDPAGPRLRYFRQAHSGPNTARNLAIAKSEGDPVCLVDDDEIVPPTWLGALVAGAGRHPDAGCLGGPMRLRLEGPSPRMCGQESIGESELDLGDREHEVDQVWSGNMAVRRFAIEQIGPFAEELRVLGHTETEWVRRLRAAGGHVVYVPDAWLWHCRTRSELRLRSLLNRNFFRGRGQAVNGSKFGLVYEPRKLVRNMRRQVGHAARERCSVGLIRAAQDAGRMVGTAEVRARRSIRRRSTR